MILLTGLLAAATTIPWVSLAQPKAGGSAPATISRDHSLAVRATAHGFVIADRLPAHAAEALPSKTIKVGDHVVLDALIGALGSTPHQGMKP